jgi:hypothetical protein
LHECAHTKNAKNTSTLIAYGADITITDNTSWMPVHTASYWGDIAGMCLLLAAGANINASTCSSGSSTCLHWAASNRQLHCMAILVAANADTTLENSDGKKAVDLLNAQDRCIFTSLITEAQLVLRREEIKKVFTYFYHHHLVLPVLISATKCIREHRDKTERDPATKRRRIQRESDLEPSSPPDEYPLGGPFGIKICSEGDVLNHIISFLVPEIVSRNIRGGRK